MGQTVRHASWSVVALLPFLLGQGPVPPTPPIPPPAPTLKIEGSLVIPEHELCTLKLVGSDKAAWLILPNVSQLDAGTSLAFAAPPGTYTVVAMAVVAGNPAFAKATVQVKSAESLESLAIAIFDPSSLTSLPAGKIAIYQSSTINAALAAQGTTWLQYASTDTIHTKDGGTPLLQTTWGTRALAVGLPALVQSFGGVVTAMPLPGNEAEVIKLCTKRAP